MKIVKNKWFIIALILIGVGIFAAFQLKGSDKPQYFTSKVDHGDIRDVVEATGTINAVTTVQVGSQVSGTISQLSADFNSRVKKGQLIAGIDPRLFEAALSQASADLDNARANLAVAKANLAKAKATEIQTKQDYDRTAGLAKEGVFSAQQLDLAKANYDSGVAATQAANAGVTQAAAQVSQKAAAVSLARTNLNYTNIYAPIDGTVVNRAVDVGQTVAASLQAPTLFTIAQDLTKMQVYAKTDESDVGNIKAGQKVTFKVDAFPRDMFTGEVAQVRMNATTVQNVVTYDTIINFDNPEMKLFPGMTAYVTIPVATATNVVRIPNGALRFKPDMKPEELQAMYQKYGFDYNPQGGSRTRSAQSGDQAAGAGASHQAGAQASGQPGGGGGEQQASMPQRKQRQDVATVWKLKADKSLEPVRVRTGITDHTVSELVQVLKGDLKEGDELIIGSAIGKPATSGTSRPAAPGTGGGPRR